MSLKIIAAIFLGVIILLLSVINTQFMVAYLQVVCYIGIVRLIISRYYEDN
jgi:hypothetical protein